MISGGNLFNIRLYKWRIFRPTYIVAELLVKKYQKWLTFRQKVKQEYVWRDVTTRLLHCKHIIASPRERHYRTPGACEIHVHRLHPSAPWLQSAYWAKSQVISPQLLMSFSLLCRWYWKSRPTEKFLPVDIVMLVLCYNLLGPNFSRVVGRHRPNTVSQLKWRPNFNPFKYDTTQRIHVPF